MKNKIKSLVVAFFILASAHAQTDSIVKAKVLDDGSQDAEKFYNSGITDFAAKIIKVLSVISVRLLH